MIERLAGSGSSSGSSEPIEQPEQQLLPHDADYGELRSNAVFERDRRRPMRQWVVAAVVCILIILIVVRLI
jgi:hypothetical protein